MSFKTLVQQNIFWKGGFIASGLLVSIVLARLLKPAITGDLYYNIAEISLFIQLAGLSLESGIGYFVAGKKMEGRSVSLIAFYWTILVTAFAVLLGWIMNGSFKMLNASDIGWFISGNLLYTYFSALYAARLSYRTPNVIGVIVNFLICIAGYLYWRSGVSGEYEISIIRMFYFSFFIKGMLVALAYWIQHPTNERTEFKGVFNLFKYSLVACLANVLTFLLYRIDYYFVEKYCSADELGNYIQASKISQMFFMLPAMTAAVIFPLASSSSIPESLVKKIMQIFRITFFGTMAACIFLAATGYWLFPMLFGPGFEKMYIPFLLMIPGIICFSSLAPITAYNAGKNRIDLNIKACILSVLFLIITDLLVVPIWKINGAATVSSGGYIIFLLYILFHFKMQHQFSLIEVFQFQKSDYSGLLSFKR